MRGGKSIYPAIPHAPLKLGTSLALSASVLYAALLMCSSPLHAASPPAGTDRYRIQSGDTLSSISLQLFGDAKYWPQLHAWNQGAIRDPNLIRPGNWILFTPGTSSALPAVGIAKAIEPSAPRASGLNQDRLSTSAARSRPRAQEWRDLPPQPWESIIPKLPPTVDDQGFDKSNKIYFRQTKGFELDAIAASDRIPSMGQIVASRVGAQYLTLGDTVYVRPDGEDLKIGETYAITQDPYRLKSSKSDRDGYSYLILGQVKLIAAKDDLFVGTIIAGKHLIPRGSELIPMPARIPQMEPLPGPAAVEGRLLIDRNLATYTSAQHKLVFINRGASDGIMPGMVFRCYEHYDPANDKKITSTDFIVDADVLVVQVSEGFSAGIVLNSFMTVVEDAPVTLLMDVSELHKRFGFGEVMSSEKQKTNELDELDGVGGTLAPDERRELEQLERWKGNPDAQPPAPQALETPPADEATPPAEPAPTPEAPQIPEEVAPPPPPAPDTMAAPPETANPPAPSSSSNDTQDLDRLLDQ